MPDPETPQNPVLAEVWRGPVLECVHRGTAVVCRPNGEIVAEWGDPARRILPRSALKPLQALPLIESGASFRAELTPRHLALACASHNGADEHTALVTEWLGALGLGEDDLRCGPQMPGDEEAGRRLMAAREAPGQIHNNCSGKHAGMLTLCRHVGGDAEYLEPDHPVQKMIRQAISEISDEEITEWAVDGCSAPNWVISLKGLATAMARFAHPGLMGPVRGPAAARLRNAMAAHPSLVAGQGRACTALIEACGGGAVVKSGAEGVYVGTIVEAGLGIALKIDDGAARGAQAAIAALLARFEALDPGHAAYRACADAPLLNRRAIDCGRIRAAETLLG